MKIKKHFQKRQGGGRDRCLKLLPSLGLLAALCETVWQTRTGHRCNLCFPEQEGQAPGRPPLSVRFYNVICPAQGKIGGFPLTKIRQI